MSLHSIQMKALPSTDVRLDWLKEKVDVWGKKTGKKTERMNVHLLKKLRATCMIESNSRTLAKNLPCLSKTKANGDPWRMVLVCRFSGARGTQKVQKRTQKYTKSILCLSFRLLVQCLAFFWFTLHFTSFPYTGLTLVVIPLYDRSQSPAGTC